MMESTGSSKPRDALLEKLRERIQDRDRALEVNMHIYIHSRDMNECQLGINSEMTRLHVDFVINTTEKRHKYASCNSQKCHK